MTTMCCSSGSSTTLFVLSFALLFVSLFSQPIQVSYDARALIINGERRIILSGSIHYPRSTPDMWQSLVRKAKEGGLNAIETYVFWNAHEPERRQYDFSGRNDLVRFIRTIQNEGLYAILRIGPYICAEWNYGGLPVWLHNMSGIKVRTDNKVFENEMANFTTLIVNLMKENKLFAIQGGPIILSQIENEYEMVVKLFGEGGKNYLQWCAQFAESLNIGVPWIMCSQDNAPKPMIPTCNGFYCDQWTPKTADPMPKMWTENWSGWFKEWGSKHPHRATEELAFSVARFFQYKGTLQNYYMYHGGTNFGRTGGQSITTSYDYDAPLDEYGNYNQPKWGHLKKLHEILKSMEKTLTYGDYRQINYHSSVDLVIYSYKGKRVCFFGNANDLTTITINFENKSYILPAWSITILDDCKTEVYNTAKVNAPTTIMVKKAIQHDNEDEPYQLKWYWRREDIVKIEKNGAVKGSVLTDTKLLEQKSVTNDTTDYLWYLTRIHHNISEWVTLRVDVAVGQVIQAFVNEKYKGYQYAPPNRSFKSFTFETKISLHKGKNDIALCSATVGLPFINTENDKIPFDNIPMGVTGVQIISGTNGSVSKNLSINPWIYKIGLEGETKKLYGVDSSKRFKWETINLPTQQPFTWYKTSFKTPMGTDPVVVDLIGLSKGQAWVNGNNIGRYWPSYLAHKKGCSPTCDYHGVYFQPKCETNCGKPTQRWYHIPRFFLHDDDRDNVLILFEEFGGSPQSVQIQTVTIGTVCANASEGNVLELSCQGGRVINRITFASFGLPSGGCGAFEKGICESSKAFSLVEQKCLGKEQCSIDIGESTLGNTGCIEASLQLGKTFAANQLAVEVECT